MVDREEAAPRPVRVRAVPWKTPTEDRVRGALGGVPAYVRRAKRLEDSTARLFDTAREAREEMLVFVALRFRQALDLLEEEHARELPPETVGALGGILEEIEALPSFCRLRERPRRAHRKRELDRALGSLGESVRRFNREWRRWLEEEAPLSEVNAQVEGYNKNYAFEKQCAVKYVPLNRIRAEKKRPLTVEDLLDRFPFLPEP
ncbi:MAG: hypothetical protein ACYTDY_00695 [Planctomycetota bacterium]|jgi:hypothetical protein